MDRVTKRANFGRTEVRGGRGKGRKREREGDGNAHKGRKRWNVLIGHAEIFVCVWGGGSFPFWSKMLFLSQNSREHTKILRVDLPF